MVQSSELLMVYFGMIDSGLPVSFCSEVIIQVALVFQFRRSFTSGNAMLASIPSTSAFPPFCHWRIYAPEAVCPITLSPATILFW
ncbi:Uncharacterised protein [Enterobacter cloacae]|nr:hypothetical protein HR12_37430 [Microbacterium sp. SUBG005]SAJ25828.1 Uncharacterised protein [Enterobacter cloacae]